MSQPNISVDNRIFPRIDCCLDLEINTFGIQAYELEAVDLSLTGVGVEFKAALNPFVFVPGTPVEVAIPGFQALKATICWSGGRRVGLKFVASFQEIFDSWVGEIMAAQGVLIKDVTRVAS